MNIEPDEDVIARFQHDHPQEAEALFQEGVEVERERVTNLLKLAHPATSAIIHRAIENGDEATEIFHTCFRARERAEKGHEPATAKSGAANPILARAQAPRPAQVQVQQRATAAEEQQFGQALKRRLDLQRAYQLRGRARREAIARAMAPQGSSPV